MAEATVTVTQPSGIGSNMQGQTRYLFNRYVHEVTRETESGSYLNARAFEAMNGMEATLLFGPDVDEALDELVGCLAKHALSIKNDVRLQELLEQMKQHFNKDTLWELCKKIFTSVDDVWTAILALFAFGLELCRQVAIVLYETVVDTITEAVMKWASNWLVSNGGWLAVMAGSGVLTGMMETLTSWLTWMRPSFLTRTLPAPGPDSAASDDIQQLAAAGESGSGEEGREEEEGGGGVPKDDEASEADPENEYQASATASTENGSSKTEEASGIGSSETPAPENGASGNASSVSAPKSKAPIATITFCR